jgi:hypothetical protein
VLSSARFKQRRRGALAVSAKGAIHRRAWGRRPKIGAIQKHQRLKRSLGAERIPGSDAPKKSRNLQNIVLTFLDGFL